MIETETHGTSATAADLRDLKRLVDRSGDGRRSQPRPMGKRIAYIVNCFPNVIETMIYREVDALRALGENITLFSIRRPKPADIPDEARHLASETVYILPLAPLRFLSSHVGALTAHPIRYGSALLEVLTGAHDSVRDRLRTLCHFLEAVTLLKEIKGRGIEHIHAHWAVGSATCAMVVSRLLGIPFSFTAHAYDIWRDRLLLPQKLRAARFVVTCTDYNRQHLASAYQIPLDRLHVVHHGVDLARFERARRRDHSEPVLLSVGRLVEQKGLDRLLRACAILAARGCRFRCEIVGDGPLRGRLVELARSLGLSDRVSFPGRKSQEELAQYFADADVFVLPCVPASDNDRDGIPNTLIEAMAMELPIVSTRFSGIPELVTTDSGVLVEPDDVEGLAGALVYLLGDASERRRMGEAGRRRVLASFTVGGSAERLQQTFARFLLGDGRQT